MNKRNVPSPWRAQSVVGIADTSAVLQDLRYSAANSPGIIQELARLGVVYCSPLVFAETDAHLHKMVSRDTPEPLLREWWDKLKPLLRTVDSNSAQMQGSDFEYLRERDPNDIPILAAARAYTGKAVILTADLDFISLGLAPHSWLTTGRVLKNIAAVDAAEGAAMLLLQSACVGSTHLLRAAFAGRTSARLGLAGLAVALLWVVAQDKRRSTTAEGLIKIGTHFVDLLAERERNIQQLELATSTALQARP